MELIEHLCSALFVELFTSLSLHQIASFRPLMSSPRLNRKKKNGKGGKGQDQNLPSLSTMLIHTSLSQKVC
jgi:hypothetical protein